MIPGYSRTQKYDAVGFILNRNISDSFVCIIVNKFAGASFLSPYHNELIILFFPSQP